MYETLLISTYSTRCYLSSHVYPAQRDRCMHLKVIIGVRWDLVTPTPTNLSINSVRVRI